MIVVLIKFALEPAALRSVVCPGDTVNYVCNRTNTRRTTIISYIWCLSSSSETCCSDSYTEQPRQIVAVENRVVTTSLCSPPFMLTYTSQHNVSNLTITVPQHTTTKLRIVCERMNLDCQYLQVAGECHNTAGFFDNDSCRCPLPSPELHTRP